MHLCGNLSVFEAVEERSTNVFDSMKKNKGSELLTACLKMDERIC